MNLAVNGLRGEITPANSYYDDPYNSYERFDYVMANPPFNVDDVNLDRVKDQKRFNQYGIPQNKTKSSAKGKQKDVNTVPNANYLWINLFATSLKPTGRAALVMPNSASDARNSEAIIRKKLVESGVIDCMLTLPKNMFYTVTLPATLWFFNKANEGKELKVLFIDARNIFRQVTRVLREFTEEHIQNIAAIVRLYRGETERFHALIARYQQQADDYAKQARAAEPDLIDATEAYDKAKETYKAIQKKIEAANGDAKNYQQELTKAGRELSKTQKAKEEQEGKYKALVEKQEYFLGHINWLQERFPNGVYEDVTGLCKAATLKEIEEQDYSLNPGRYVGVVIEEDGLTEQEFLQEMKERHKTLSDLNSKARSLESIIAENFTLLDRNNEKLERI